MPRVIVESPFAGDIQRNIKYAREALRDCIRRGESPFASHLLYTQEGVLDDDIPSERELGISCGFDWSDVAHYVVVYRDFGISQGMREGIAKARKAGLRIIYRTLYGSRYDIEETVA